MSLREKLNDYYLLKRCWKSILWNKSVAKRERSQGIDDVTIQQFYLKEVDNLFSLFNLLKNNTYIISKLFGFYIKKENKKDFRLITAPTVKDRIVHKAMLFLLSKKMHSYINTGVSYCGVNRTMLSLIKNEEALNTKSALAKVIEHVGNRNYWIFKTDIKKFYDNVPKRRLFNLFKKLTLNLVEDSSLDFLVKQIIFFKIGNYEEIVKENKGPLPDRHRGISQGSSLSQFFANIYLADLDVKMKSKYADKFIRYIDDILIICSTKEEAEKAKEDTIKYLKKLSLTVSPEKTHIVNINKKSINFLGLNISTKGIQWKKSKKEALKWINDVLDLNNYLYKKVCKNDAERFKKMNDRIQGLTEYLRFYHTIDTYELINKQIKHKISRNKKYKSVKYADTKRIKVLITNKKWKSFF